MSITKAALRLASPLPKIERCQRFLFVGPHPDDIELGAGATAAKLCEMGKDVRFVICTDGRYGTSNAPKGISPDALAELRKREACASAAALGAEEPVFLDFSDGGFYDKEDLTAALVREVAAFRPQVLFVPDPWVSSECHRDHLNVGNVVANLACFAPNPGVMARYGAQAVPIQAIAFYMTARPNAYVDVRRTFSRQLEAIRCHQSQFPDGSPDQKSLFLYLRLRACDFGLKRLCGRAEGFRVLGQTQMHCLPEAGDMSF